MKKIKKKNKKNKHRIESKKVTKIPLVQTKISKFNVGAVPIIENIQVKQIKKTKTKIHPKQQKRTILKQGEKKILSEDKKLKMINRILGRDNN